MTDAEKKLRIDAWVTAICLLGDSALYVVLPLFYTEFGLRSLWEVGVLLAFNRLIRLPLHPLIRRFYETRDEKLSGLRIGAGLTFLATLGYAVSDGFWILLLAHLLSWL